MVNTKYLLAFAAASLLTVSGCVGKTPSFNAVARCDHAQPKQFTVKISVSQYPTKAPQVEPESVVACFADTIVFKTVGSDFDFKLDFNKASPFKGKLRSSQGVATAKVSVKPRADIEAYKYTVVVPGYPPRDPWIRIVTR